MSPTEAMAGSTEFYPAILLLLFIVPALGGFLFGYDIGATSFVVTQITDGNHDGVKWSGLVSSNSALEGAITSASVFGALLSSIIIFKLADYMGRVLELKVGAILYLIGAFIEALAAQSSFSADVGITVLLIGRIVYGCGIGIAMHAAPAYIGEMSPPSIRGLLISLKEAMIVLGILGGYLVGFIFATVDGGWMFTYGMAMVFAFPMIVGSFFLKESTRWLFLKGRRAEAKAALQWVLIPDAADAAYAEMALQADAIMGGDVAGSAARSASSASKQEDDPQERRQQQPDSVWSKRFRPALIAGIGLVFLQQVTGQPSVLYYAASIFSNAGLASVATVGVAAFKLVMTLITVFTVDRFGRKLLLYIGISVMLVALIALTIGFLFMGSDDGGGGELSPTQTVVLVAMFIYIGGYQIGFGPISWLLISEVFPLEVRGQAVALAVQNNFFWNVVTTYMFPVEEQLIGPSFTFLIFTGICAYSLYFVYRNVPETKGLTLEQIEMLLEGTHSRHSLLAAAGRDVEADSSATGGFRTAHGDNPTSPLINARH